jgi:hypothetical protein
MIPEVPRGVLSDKKKFEKIDLFGWKIGRFRWDLQLGTAAGGGREGKKRRDQVENDP